MSLMHDGSEDEAYLLNHDDDGFGMAIGQEYVDLEPEHSVQDMDEACREAIERTGTPIPANDNKAGRKAGMIGTFADLYGDFYNTRQPVMDIAGWN